MTIQSSTLDVSALDKELLAELRSDHAGEYGAVIIYNGILAVSRSPEVRRFASTHRATELEHLQFMEDYLPPPQRTRLLPLWRLMAWQLGALPALFGPKAVYVTINAVESFVETHYQRQIALLADKPEHDTLRRALERFCADEVEHKEDAAMRFEDSPGLITHLWKTVVGGGSALAVAISKKL